PFWFFSLFYGEKSTAFFLAQEKRKQTNVTINELINEKGEKVSDITSILETVQNFYSQLFTSENISTNKINQVVGVIDSSLSQEDSLCCDAPLTEEEIQHAIKSLNNNKSLGHDGITLIFYKQFKDPISKILLQVFSVMEQTGCTPRTFAQGVITILYKNKGDRNNLENYRPISLLDTDYKIYSKTLANRLKSVIGTLISSSQAYGIPQRNISDTVLSINHIIQSMVSSQGIFLNIDFSKAFNRVEHNFLWEVLNKFGFGQSFISKLQLYLKAESKVKFSPVFSILFFGFWTFFVFLFCGFTSPQCPTVGEGFSFFAIEFLKDKRTDPSVLINLERNTDTSMEQVKITVFEKENTVQIEVVGEEISVLDLMKNISFLCGGLLACRLLTDRKFAITLSNEKAKK
uniref:Reverse transcriptase domain-containing protein n=1 Tax=Poecilia reticulata TaxID=8081 RepID=A0A3P9PCI2_POERE